MLINNYIEKIIFIYTIMSLDFVIEDYHITKVV